MCRGSMPHSSAHEKQGRFHAPAGCCSFHGLFDIRIVFDGDDPRVCVDAERVEADVDLVSAGQRGLPAEADVVGFGAVPVGHAVRDASDVEGVCQFDPLAAAAV